MKRSNAPIFWALFGAGGMLAALAGPVLVLITGVAIPLNFLLHGELMQYSRMLVFARHPLGKLIILAVVVLFLWHAAHRIYKSLHDIGIHPSPMSRMACYGSALAGTVVALYGVLAVGF